MNSVFLFSVVTDNNIINNPSAASIARVYFSIPTHTGCLLICLRTIKR